jgi:hypothetical protein
MYVGRNIEEGSCSQSCSGEAIINTYSECVPVASGIENAMRRHHIVIRGLSGRTICFHIVKKGKIFEKILLNLKYLFGFYLRFFVSNKSTNEFQHFHKFITRRSYVAQHVLGVSPPIIRSIQLQWEPLVLPGAGIGWFGRLITGQTTIRSAPADSC